MEKVEMKEAPRDTQKRTLLQTVVIWLAGLCFAFLLVMAVIRKFAG